MIKLIKFLEDMIRSHSLFPSQLARDLGVSHATVSRWLSGKDIPSVSSCMKIAQYADEAPQRVLSIAGHLPELPDEEAANWPAFREYARRKYAKELDEDVITMIEDLIRRRRRRRKANNATRL